MYLDDVMAIIATIGVATIVAIILINTSSNMSRNRRKNKALVYAEFSDYKTSVEIYVVETVLYKRVDGMETKLKQCESRNRAIMEFTNKCAGISKEMYDRG